MCDGIELAFDGGPLMRMYPARRPSGHDRGNSRNRGERPAGMAGQTCPTVNSTWVGFGHIG